MESGGYQPVLNNSQQFEYLTMSSRSTLGKVQSDCGAGRLCVVTITLNLVLALWKRPERAASPIATYCAFSATVALRDKATPLQPSPPTEHIHNQQHGEQRGTIRRPAVLPTGNRLLSDLLLKTQCWIKYLATGRELTSRSSGIVEEWHSHGSPTFNGG